MLLRWGRQVLKIVNLILFLSILRMLMSRDVGENSQLGLLLKLLCGQITDEAVVIVRTEEMVELLENYGTLHVIDRRKWGSMSIALLQNQASEVNR